jgi:predicted NBD/HSP70 family sugar kinase
MKNGPLSRTDLARETGLTTATITRIISRFIAAGLAAETETAGEEGALGRRPILLQLNHNAGYVFGLKLRETGMTLVLCDLNGVIVHMHEVAYAVGSSARELVEIIIREVTATVEATKVARGRILGMGIGLSGLVDFAGGVCRYSPILGWKDEEIGPALEYRLRMPVRVDNDVNMLTVAEQHFGDGHNLSNFLLLVIGRGIGLGIVINGEVYRGLAGGAGEFGHTVVDLRPDAPLCGCGRRGCLEAFASDYAILRAIFHEEPQPPFEPLMLDLIKRLQDGEKDEHIRQPFQAAGAAIGIAVANLINIFAPSRIILFNMSFNAGEVILEPLRETLQTHALIPHQTDWITRLTMIDETLWARGAASLILNEMYAPPTQTSEQESMIEQLLAARPTSRQRKEVKSTLGVPS